MRQPTTKPVVQKYGGTSVADEACLRRVARTVARVRRTAPVVAVVSARAGLTDELLRIADAHGGTASSRETDQLLATGEGASAALLAMVLNASGVPAVSLTGPQAGIHAAGPAGEGRITGIDTTRIQRHLAEGLVVVVAGFQGLDPHGDLLTLGRGGSDTTAVALAAALGAPRCDIFTDVDGVYSADPRVIPTARRLDDVPIDVMVEMAFAGAKVLHARSVELAAARGVPLRVASSFTADHPGTLIGTPEVAGSLRHQSTPAQPTPAQPTPAQPTPAQPLGADRKGRDRQMSESFGVTAIVSDGDVARVLIRFPRQAVTASAQDPVVPVLALFARHNAPVDLVARSGPFEEECRVGFSMRRSDMRRILPELRTDIAGSGGELVVDEQVAKVSVIGTGLLNRPAITARALSVLADATIPVSWVSTSQARTSVIVPADRATAALTLLHDAFDLNRGHRNRPQTPPHHDPEPTKPDPAKPDLAAPAGTPPVALPDVVPDGVRVLT